MIDTQRLKIAVFIDFDNIEIGVKTTLHTPFDIAAILDGIKERGEVVTKVAYGDWKRAGDYGRLLSQHAIRMVQRNLTPGGDKNGADINLALDALEMAFTHDHINAFVIVGGDSDFITLVEKLKQYRQESVRRRRPAVHQPGDAEELPRVHRVREPRGRTQADRHRARSARMASAVALPSTAPADVSKVIPLVKRALKVLADREVSPQLGLLKSTLLQLDSTFSERDYGVSTFRDFIEKIAKTGIITLRHSGRSMLVDAAEGATEVVESQTATPAVAADRERRRRAGRHARRSPAASAGLAPAVGPRSRADSADDGATQRTVHRSCADTALAHVRPADQAVPARRRSELRRAQMGLLDHHGVPARVPARRIVPAGARPQRPGAGVCRVRRCRGRRRCRSDRSPVQPDQGSSSAAAGLLVRQRSSSAGSFESLRTTQPIRSGTPIEEHAEPGTYGRASRFALAGPGRARRAGKPAARKPTGVKAAPRRGKPADRQPAEPASAGRSRPPARARRA